MRVRAVTVQPKPPKAIAISKRYWFKQLIPSPGPRIITWVLNFAVWPLDAEPGGPTWLLLVRFWSLLIISCAMAPSISSLEPTTLTRATRNRLNADSSNAYNNWDTRSLLNHYPLLRNVYFRGSVRHRSRVSIPITGI